MKENSLFDRINQWARHSLTLKMLTIGLLALLLLIPVGLLQSLINERQQLRDEAIREVSSKWGLEQTLIGPILSVPYDYVRSGPDGELLRETGYAHFLPDQLQIDGALQPQERYRGIYVVVLYETRLAIETTFKNLHPEALNIPETALQWSNAQLTIGISDMKGIESAIEVVGNDTTYAFGPGTPSNDIFDSGASLPLGLNAQPDSLDFGFELRLKGSSQLSFAPFGRTTTVSLTSGWPNPSFEGAFLPDQRAVTDTGFTATWRVLELNRNYAQQGIGSFIGRAAPGVPVVRNEYAAPPPGNYHLSTFGLRLLLPIDEYQKTMRSAKYATFFVLITFLTFFFIEVLNRRRLHPIQYLLIGSAIILFYILLLSVSEHFAFNSAYLVSAAIILGLITFYSAFVLRNLRLTLLVGSILAVLYGFFYSLLQLRDYALLLGSIGLLLILATIMYLTRNIDWYNFGADQP